MTPCQPVLDYSNEERVIPTVHPISPNLLGLKNWGQEFRWPGIFDRDWIWGGVSFTAKQERYRGGWAWLCQWLWWRGNHSPRFFCVIEKSETVFCYGRYPAFENVIKVIFSELRTGDGGGTFIWLLWLSDQHLSPPYNILVFFGQNRTDIVPEHKIKTLEWVETKCGTFILMWFPRCHPNPLTLFWKWKRGVTGGSVNYRTFRFLKSWNNEL